MTTYHEQKLLVANRGEIVVRILRTARKLGLRSVAIYSPSDATSPHVDLADEAVPLYNPTNPVGSNASSGGAQESESQAYLSTERILSICRTHNVTLVHPGYGFLSENAQFAQFVIDTGITWLGPTPDVIMAMGVKHTARTLAKQAGIAICPGSEGLVEGVEEAVEVARRIGWPVILKATAGGGGMGMVACRDEREVREQFGKTGDRANVLFSDRGVFIEHYFESARHIEIQIFGNGRGNVVHMGERECSIQRRHQKVLEETPSPFFADYPATRDAMCEAAVRFGKLLNYSSAGTVEFLVDDTTGKFYFLEMNTRIQVEHPITEVTHPGLDIVEMMIDQGIAERRDQTQLASKDLDIWMDKIPKRDLNLHAIEARIYAENPTQEFRPCPGLLQHVVIPNETCDWLRVDSWVATGTTITLHFDPLICKIIVTGSSREQAIARLRQVLDKSRICGPPNNVEYLKAVLDSLAFKEGRATTSFLEKFTSTPRAMTVLSSGLEMLVQDLPGRLIGLGIPRSGPMDPIAFQIANILVGNEPNMEGLEVITMPGVGCTLQFHVASVVAVAGKTVIVKVNGIEVGMWESILVPAGGKIEIRDKARHEDRRGFRVYLAVRGGFPSIPKYLGSKSTSMGLGGYQGRSLLPGDQLALGRCEPTESENVNKRLLEAMIPSYPADMVIHVLSGPQDDAEFVTEEGIQKFYATSFTVSPSSNRMGIRLDCSEKIQWARSNGGEGGSHPSNILDNAYAFGSVNINGDTPVILCNEGPDMGGYVCLCTIASAEMWKLGQLAPGNTIQFKRISWQAAIQLKQRNEAWIKSAQQAISNPQVSILNLGLRDSEVDVSLNGPKLLVARSEPGSRKPVVTFRQAGDSSILVEFGPMRLDFNIRALVHAFELEILGLRLGYIKRLCPCIRSTMCHYDPLQTSQSSMLMIFQDALKRLPESIAEMKFPNREITLPIVPDDSWCQEAIERYMKTTRDKAVYLPSNVQYLAQNNGLAGGKAEALRKLVESDWLVFGVGFYLACPFLVPVDPRCRLVGQKMNPSRTHTPRGAIGIAGVVAAIYPVESPGGYQLYGRTLPAWHTWGRGRHFSPEEPWLLRPFDKIRFRVASEKEYTNLEQQFDAGRYEFEVKPSTFSMDEYNTFVKSIEDEVAIFRDAQAAAVAREEERERLLLAEWESARRSASHSGPNVEPIDPGSSPVVSPIFATVWKIKVQVGDIITSSTDPVVILESMKTEINVYAEEDSVGKRVIGYGRGVKEGALVKPNDILLRLD